MKAGNINMNDEKELTGKVVLKFFGAGSKSEYDSVCIETGDKSYVLRRIGGNPFNDPVLHTLVGKNVVVTGVIDKYIFLVKHIKEVNADL